MQITPHIYHFECLDSTNDEAKRQIEKGTALPALFIADRQTAGRGRRGRSFFSEGGLYMTLALPFSDTRQNAVKITAISAVSVAQTIERLCGIRVGIKWVNDLYFEDKKVCGILCETVADKLSGEVRAVIIGVGINLNVNRFPSELEDIAGGLSSETEPKRLAEEISRRIGEIFYGEEDYTEYYKSRSTVIGKDIYYFKNGERYEARAVGIDDDFALIIETPDKRRELLSSGEITVRVKTQPTAEFLGKR